MVIGNKVNCERRVKRDGSYETGNETGFNSQQEMMQGLQKQVMMRDGKVKDLRK